MLILFDANAAVFHLAPGAFELDRAAGRNFHRGLKDFAGAHTVSGLAFNDDLKFVPITLTIVLQLFVRAGQRVVAALKLIAANKHAAVGVGRGAEFEAQSEVLGEFARGGNFLDASAFRRRGDYEPAIFGDITAVSAFLLPIEHHWVIDHRPKRHVRWEGEK